MLRLSTSLIAAGVAITAFTAMPAPAEARSTCRFFATNGSGFLVVTSAAARKMDRACKRAKRKCNRQVNRAQRRGEISRGPRTVECLRHS